MPQRLDELLARITSLEREVESELNAVRGRWHYRIDAGRVNFERDVRAAHRRMKQGLLSFLRRSSLLSVLTAPVIYGMVVPIALLDLSLSIYQTVCFRVYGISRVKRSAYIVIDRQYLEYLNGIEKLNCVYCGYANGVFAYVREIAARTEQYWCPIRHARRLQAPHAHYRNFVDYGDAEAYQAELPQLRRALKDEPHAPGH